MKETKNFFLQKLEGLDKFDCKVINEDWQKTDDALNELLNGGDSVILPTMTIEKTENGYRVTTKEVKDSQTFELYNGADGKTAYQCIQEYESTGTEEFASSLAYSGSSGASTTNNVLYYNSVFDMQSDETLLAETTCITLGYYAVNDGGGATYKTRTKATNDENKIECVVCANATAEIIVNEHDTVNVLQFGLKNDGSEDCAETFMKLVISNKWYNIYFPSGEYAFYSPLVITNYHPYHRIYGNMPHTRKNWDNHGMATHLYYYPQENDTTFILFGGEHVEMEKLYIHCGEYGKNTTGFNFNAVRSRIKDIRIADFDNVCLYVEAPYSFIENVECGALDNYINYVKEDMENRQPHAMCEFINRPTVCNNVVNGLTLGSPTYAIYKYGLIVGGVGNKFISTMCPSSAFNPVVFKSSAISCSMENSYFEYNENVGDIDNFITFEKGSKNNYIKQNYMSGFLKYKDYGMFNTVESIFTGLIGIGGRIFFEKLSKNLCDIKVVEKDDGTFNFESANTENGFHFLGFYGNNLPIGVDEDGFILVDNTIRNNLVCRLKVDSYIGKYFDDDVYIVFGSELKNVDADSFNCELISPSYLNSASDIMQIPNYQHGNKYDNICYGIAKLSKEYLSEYAHLTMNLFDTRNNQGTGTFKYRPFFYLLYRGMRPIELPQ